MFKKIKKELTELKEHKEHMAYVPENSLDTEYNFDEISKLTTRINAGFKVTGDHKHFTIQVKPFNILLGILISTFLGIMVISLYRNPTEPFNWLITFIFLAIIFLFLRYYPGTNNIEINTYDRTIKIKSNNFIGRYIIPSKAISFEDFTGLTFKAKSTSGSGISNHYHRVYIYCNGKTVPLIDLPNGPFYYINHNVFMKCLTQIIQSADSCAR